MKLLTIWNSMCHSLKVHLWTAYWLVWMLIYITRYDTFFGHIVPHVMANVLKIHIVIIHQYVDSCGMSVISQRENHSDDVTSYLFVFKTGKYYDGLTHVSSNSDLAVFNCTILDCNIIDNGEDLSNNIYFSMTAGSELENHIYTGRESIMVERARHNDGPRVNIGREHVIDGNDIDDFSHAGLNIMVWNINGLSQGKLDKRTTGYMLLKYDIILLCETWAAQDAEFFLNGFEYHNYHRKYKHRCAKRHSGGIVMFIKKTINEGVTLGSYTNYAIAWVVLKKIILPSSPRYTFSLYIYCAWRFYEFHTRCIWSNKWPHVKGNDVILCGEYNARTGSMFDLNVNLTNGTSGELNPLPPSNVANGIYLSINCIHWDYLKEVTRTWWLMRLVLG